MTAVLYSFVTDDLDSCLSYFTLPMKAQPQYPPSFTYVSPQYSLSLSESAFVIPSFGSLPTTTQVFMKVCTTAHSGFGISFSNLACFSLKAFRAGIAYLPESHVLLHYLYDRNRTTGRVFVYLFCFPLQILHLTGTKTT